MRVILMFHNCEGQSHKTVSTHTTFEEKGEPKRIWTEVPLLTSLTPYRWTKPAHGLEEKGLWIEMHAFPTDLLGTTNDHWATPAPADQGPESQGVLITGGGPAGQSQWRETASVAQGWTRSCDFPSRPPPSSSRESTSWLGLMPVIWRCANLWALGT